jgi:mono/diheme cytochrome c family protein
MIKGLRLLIFMAAMYTTSGFALSPEAIEGEALYPACNACHNQANDPPLGPPMWGVQRRYKKSTLNDADFVERMVSFVKAPTLETAIHAEALGQLGLMPAMPLPDDMLNNIVTYVLEEQFPPPCDHWRIAVSKAEEKGDIAHAQKEQRQIKRFCN